MPTAMLSKLLLAAYPIGLGVYPILLGICAIAGLSGWTQ